HAVHADGPRADDDRLAGRATVADFATFYFRFRPTGPGERADGPRLHIDAPNPPVGHVGNEQAALAVEYAVIGLAQAGVESVLAVPGVVLLAVAGIQRHIVLGRVDPADHRVKPVGDVEVAVGIDSDGIRLVKRRLGRGLAVSGVALFTIARHRG